MLLELYIIKEKNREPSHLEMENRLMSIIP